MILVCQVIDIPLRHPPLGVYLIVEGWTLWSIKLSTRVSAPAIAGGSSTLKEKIVENQSVGLEAEQTTEQPVDIRELDLEELCAVYGGGPSTRALA